MNRPIIARTDGSACSLLAVDWAAGEAIRHRAPLHVVYIPGDHPGTHFLPAGRQAHHRARVALARARKHVHAAGRNPDAEASFVEAEAVQTQTGGAAMLVTGSGLGGTATTSSFGIIGSMTAGSAPCQIVVGTEQDDGPHDEIVVGFGSTADTAALEFALGEAVVRHAAVLAVRAWAHPEAGYPDNCDQWALSIDDLGSDETASLSQQLDPWRQRFPGVRMTGMAVHGKPGPVLTAASAHADLMVVGGPAAATAGAPLGPVTCSVLRHAHCPVALIPARHALS
jgi:nucleotide-binding universal stress UspA family protein